MMAAQIRKMDAQSLVEQGRVVCIMQGSKVGNSFHQQDEWDEMRSDKQRPYITSQTDAASQVRDAALSCSACSGVPDYKVYAILDLPDDLRHVFIAVTEADQYTRRGYHAAA